MSELKPGQVAIYIPARKSVYRIDGRELTKKLKALRDHEDVLFHYFHILTEKEFIQVTAALLK